MDSDMTLQQMHKWKHMQLFNRLIDK